MWLLPSLSWRASFSSDGPIAPPLQSKLTAPGLRRTNILLAGFVAPYAVLGAGFPPPISQSPLELPLLRLNPDTHPERIHRRDLLSPEIEPGHRLDLLRKERSLVRFRLAWLLLILLSIISGLPSHADAQNEGVTPEDLSKTIVFLPIEGEITARRCNSVWRKTERLVAQDCKKIVYVIDTDGGDYRAAYDLARKIYELQS